MPAVVTTPLHAQNARPETITDMAEEGGIITRDMTENCWSQPHNTAKLLPNSAKAVSLQAVSRTLTPSRSEM